MRWFGDPPSLVARWNQPPDELVNPKATGLSERAAEAGDRLAPVTRQLLKTEVDPETPPAVTASLELAGSQLRVWSLLAASPLAGVHSLLVMS